MKTYRNDIDGLRALAVLSVIAFHFGGIISGGFVGVDIFFVISGFLITSIIVRDLEKDCFSFKEFYKRRIKRILPAFYFVLIATFTAAYFLMPPYEMYNMSGAAMAAILNASNIFFWKTANYFDVSVFYKPLLHTWSLAVEEQFYIFFPALLWFLFRKSRFTFPEIIFILCILSFILSVALQNSMASANFYLLPTRAWELGAGSLLAIYMKQPLKSQKVQLVCGTVGLLGMVVPIFFYTESMIFPGLAALPVVIGTVLFLLAGVGGSHPFAKVLECAPITWVGKISYSLYLWHWPAFVFCLLVFGKSALSYGVMILVTLIGATVSYYYVETPLRHIKDKAQEKITLYMIGFLSLVFILIGWYVRSNEGLGKVRFDAAYHGAFEGQFDYDSDMKGCSESPNRVHDLTHCVKGATTTEAPKILLWGDSHGRSFLAGLNMQAKAYNQSILVRNFGGCAPMTDAIYVQRKACQDVSREMIKLIQKQDFDKVILVARWSLHYDASERNTHNKVFADSGLIAADQVSDYFTKDFTKLVNIISETGAKIYVIDTVPGHSAHIPEVILRGNLPDFGRTAEIEQAVTTAEQYENDNAGFRQLVATLQQEHKNIQLIMHDNYLCPEGAKYCLYKNDDGKAYYRDTNHLSEFGSKMISPIFAPIFQE